MCWLYRWLEGVFCGPWWHRQHLWQWRANNSSVASSGGTELVAVAGETGTGIEEDVEVDSWDNEDDRDRGGSIREVQERRERCKSITLSLSHNSSASRQHLAAFHVCSAGGIAGGDSDGAGGGCEHNGDGHGGGCCCLWWW